MNDRTQRAYLEAGIKAAKEGKYDGTTMREVLQWADENVSGCYFRWGEWRIKLSNGIPDSSAPTLYQALHTAWEGRDK